MLQRNIPIILCILAILGYIIKRIGGETRKEYYDDGKIKAIYPLNKKGLIDGVAKTYYPNGKIKSEKKYENNKQIGITKNYYASGKLKAKGNYKDGMREGIFKKHYESGKLLAEENFNDGKRLSLTCYGEQGTTIKCPEK